jgi:hypothetical protein
MPWTITIQKAPGLESDLQFSTPDEDGVIRFGLFAESGRLVCFEADTKEELIKSILEFALLTGRATLEQLKKDFPANHPEPQKPTEHKTPFLEALESFNMEMESC